MDGWKDDWSRECKKGKGGTLGAWATRSSVQIRDKRKHENKEQRRKERMYSTRVDYSTLSIYSLHRHDEDTVLLPSPPGGAHLLPSPPAGATSDMDKAAILLPSAPPDATPDRGEQTTTEGHGEEDRHDRPSTPCPHGGNAGGINIITSGGNVKGTTGS
jgi:hypothetical protein